MASISVVYSLATDLALARGLSSLKDRPGLTRLKIDDSWTVSINPHREGVGGVPFGYMLFEFNGWPAGLVAPSGGAIATGAAANEDVLIAALQAALANEEPHA